MERSFCRWISSPAGSPQGVVPLGVAGFIVCALWSIGAAVWPGLIADKQGEVSTLAPTLTTLATIAAAAIVLGLSAVLIGLQVLSRYGSRASRSIMDQTFGVLILLAGILGVGLPIWATVEPWRWLYVLAFAAFAWGMLALAIASYLTVTHLNAHWLTLHLVKRVFPLAETKNEAMFEPLGELQSTLLQIAAGSDDTEPGLPVTLRAIALVGLARYRMDPKNADLQHLIDQLASQARWPNPAKVSPEEFASLLALLARASDDRDTTFCALRAIRDLVQDGIQQHHPVSPSLLDGAAGIVTDRLKSLLASSSIAWLLAQIPIKPARSDLFPTFPGGQVITAGAKDEHPAPRIPDRVSWKVVRDWLETSGSPKREEWESLSALVPVYEGDGEEERSPEAGSEGDQLFEASDLQDEVLSILDGACAAPTPDDTTWPGGWRGVNALEQDIARLCSIGLSLYEAGRYPPTDRVEQAIEAIALRLIHQRRSGRHADDLSNVTGWRMGEAAGEPTTAYAANESLRELAIAAWRAGFARRSLLTIRRLLSIITYVVQSGDAKLLENIYMNLQLAFSRTAKSTNTYLAERERSRQLVLGLAPDFMALARAAEPHTDDALWTRVLSTLTAIAWSPLGSESETANNVYLYFLSGIGIGEAPQVGGPWDVVPWRHRPTCQPHELLPQVREELFGRFHSAAMLSQPGIALLAVLALWRDVLVRDDRATLERFRDALEKHVIDQGRRDFELPALWSPSGSSGDPAPRFEGPRIHWRLFDVARAALRWARTKLETGEPLPAVLPPVTTPDAELRSLITTFGAERLVDERTYWGVEAGKDYFIFVEEADRSRRLLRDCEERARAQFAWGYGGTGPSNLGEVLVADMLGPLAYCPSCFGAIGAGGGLVKCPSCGGAGLRRDLLSLQGALCHKVASLPREPDPSLLTSEACPSGAHWRMSRTHFLQRAFQLVDELDAEDRSEDGLCDGA